MDPSQFLKNQLAPATKVEMRVEEAQKKATKTMLLGENPYNAYYPSVATTEQNRNQPFIIPVAQAEADSGNQVIILGGNYDMRQYIATQITGKLLGSQYGKVCAGLNATLAGLAMLCQIQVNGGNLQNVVASMTLYKMDGQAGLSSTSVDFSGPQDQTNNYKINANGIFTLANDCAIVIELAKPTTTGATNTANVIVQPTYAILR